MSKETFSDSVPFIIAQFGIGISEEMKQRFAEVLTEVRKSQPALFSGESLYINAVVEILSIHYSARIATALAFQAGRAWERLHKGESSQQAGIRKGGER